VQLVVIETYDSRAQRLRTLTEFQLEDLRISCDDGELHVLRRTPQTDRSQEALEV